MPTGYDRLLATRFGGAAVRAIADGKWGHMVALQSPHIVTHSDRRGAARAEAGRSDARRRADGAGDGDQLRGLSARSSGLDARTAPSLGQSFLTPDTAIPCGTDTGTGNMYTVFPVSG